MRKTLLILLIALVAAGCGNIDWKISSKSYDVDCKPMCVYHYDHSWHSFQDSCHLYKVGDTLITTK